MTAPELLHVAGLCKHFGGIAAVDAVSLTVRAGELVGLIGPNGSGRTTLLNLVTGSYPPERGTVRLAGEEVTGRSPNRIFRAGIVRMFQHVKVFRPAAVSRDGTEAPRPRRGGPTPQPEPSVGCRSGRTRIRARSSSFGEDEVLR